ncbi:gyp-like protein [Saccharomyces pastorianus]|uniref:Gyp-like protein n=1 Tax=Saccharomyces pastorianus TaxID=27292 RepID=A0A6C1EE15_SACPS|nr:gyp-like protein [Saccharomyces pastorianus]
MNEKNENTEHLMTSDENTLGEQLEIPATSHPDQLKENLDDIVSGNENLIIDSSNETNLNKEVEALAAGTNIGVDLNQSINDRTSIDGLTDSHDAPIPKEPEVEPQEEAPLISENLSQQLENERSKVERALEAISSPSLPPRDNDVGSFTPVPTKSSSPPVPSRNTNVQVSLDQPQLPPRQKLNAETLHLKAPHSSAVPVRPLTNTFGNSSSPAPPILPPRRIEDPLDLAAQKELLASTFKRNMLFYKNKDNSVKNDLDENMLILRENFQKISTDRLSEEDSSFWRKTVNDYQQTLLNDSESLHVQLARGIPSIYRLIVWQLVSYAKSKSFELIYETYLTQDAPFDVQKFEDQLKVIDTISSTNVKSIINVLKAYLLFDSECEFSIDMVYIVNMVLAVCKKETDAFGLFVRLMQVYDLRSLFLPSAPVINVLCYKFDRLVEESYPKVYNHMVKEGIRSSMFLPSFFTTLFQKYSSIEIQPRIGDIIFLEGLDSIMRIPAKLLCEAQDQLLKMSFEELLEFLKVGLLDAYIKKETDTESDPLSLNNCIDQLIQDAMTEVQIFPKTMKKFASEYEEIHRLDNEREEQYKSITEKNLHLQKHVRKLENDYTSLNREHVTIANELVKNRLKIESVLNENNGYKLKILDLKKTLDTEKKKQVSIVYVPNDLKKDLDETIKKNAQVMDENLKLQDKISELERMAEAISTASKNGVLFEYSNPKNHSLGAGWSGFKKVFK